MKCLDSSLLAAYTRGRDAALEYIEGHRGETLYLPTIALYEMYYGVTAVGAVVSIDELAAAFTWGDELPLTAAHAAEAARIRRDLADRGETIPHPDLLIAGAARSEGAAVVTRDAHFDRVNGLSVERF